MGRKRIVLMAACMACLVLGCGGSRTGDDPLQQAKRATLEGSYQVKALEEGEALGVGIYDNGSFRVVLEGTPSMIIYNAEIGEGWMVNLHVKTCKKISYEEAAKRAGFMPHAAMKPYFEVERYWGEEGFNMETSDGRSIRVYLEAPDYLPSAWEARLRGDIIRRIDWEYRRVGAVSQENFLLPEGLNEQS